MSNIYGKWTRGKICRRCRLVYGLRPGVICGECGSMLHQATHRSVYERKKWLWVIPYNSFVDIQIKGEDA